MPTPQGAYCLLQNGTMHWFDAMWLKSFCATPASKICPRSHASEPLSAKTICPSTDLAARGITEATIAARMHLRQSWMLGLPPSMAKSPPSPWPTKPPETFLHCSPTPTMKAKVVDQCYCSTVCENWLRDHQLCPSAHLDTDNRTVRQLDFMPNVVGPRYRSRCAMKFSCGNRLVKTLLTVKRQRRTNCAHVPQHLWSSVSCFHLWRKPWARHWRAGGWLPSGFETDARLHPGLSRQAQTRHQQVS